MYLSKWCALLLGAVATQAAAPYAWGERLLPSEATTLMVRALAHNPDTERTRLTQPIIERMQTEALDDIQLFLKGEAHFINFEPEPARDAFWEFRDRDGDLGRVAWQRLMIIRVNAFGMVDQVVDHDIPAYRRKFGISAHDRFGISYPVMQAARLMAGRGEANGALDLVTDEVRRHASFDAPYFAYRLPDAFIELARQNGRGEEFRKLREWVRAGITEAIERWLEESSESPDGRKAYELPGAMLGTLYEDQRLSHQDVTAKFLELRAALRTVTS